MEASKNWRMTPRLRARILALVLAIAVVAAPAAHSVVNGTPVEEGDRSFMAAIMDGDFQFCGGSVVAPAVVVTAAHCFVDPISGEESIPEDLAVSVGSTDYTAGEVIDVVEVIVHPDYADESSADVAVLRLAETVPASVTPISLATAADDALEAPGSPAIVAGWGSQTPIVGQVPPLDTDLYEVELRVVADDDPACGTPDPDDQVCAADFLEDSCQGDSGGPLFADLPEGEVQIGIVSSGVGCGVPEFAGYYTEINGPRIATFLSEHVSTANAGGTKTNRGKSRK